MDLAALCDTYVELKIVPIDAICLFSVLIEDLPTTLWFPPTLPHTPLEVLVVLV